MRGSTRRGRRRSRRRARYRPQSHSRVFWVMCLFLQGASQANPERRRRVVLSWARAAHNTRSVSWAGPQFQVGLDLAVEVVVRCDPGGLRGGGPVVRLDGGAKGPGGIEEARLHGPDGDLEGDGDLRLAPSQVVVKHDDRPLVGRQAPESPIQAIPIRDEDVGSAMPAMSIGSTRRWRSSGDLGRPRGSRPARGSGEPRSNRSGSGGSEGLARLREGSLDASSARWRSRRIRYAIARSRSPAMAIRPAYASSSPWFARSTRVDPCRPPSRVPKRTLHP